MNLEQEQKGRRIFFGALSRGGGKNARQAIELMNLDDDSFECMCAYIHHIVTDPMLFEQIVQRVNKIHEDINEYNGIKPPFAGAPTDLTPVDLMHDLKKTIGIAIEECLPMVNNVTTLRHKSLATLYDRLHLLNVIRTIE